MNLDKLFPTKLVQAQAERDRPRQEAFYALANEVFKLGRKKRKKRRKK